MRYGVHIVEDLKDGLLRHLRRQGQGHDSVSDMIGVSLPYLQSAENLDLSTEAVSEIVPELCIGCGCGACVNICRDGAVDAIELTEDGVARSKLLHGNTVGSSAL